MRNVVIGLLLIILATIVSSSQIKFDFRSRAAYKPANITVAADQIGKPISTTFYHAFAQGGEEPQDMIAPVTGLVSGLKPKVIRIDHVFDQLIKVLGFFAFTVYPAVFVGVRKFFNTQRIGNNNFFVRVFDGNFLDFLNYRGSGLLFIVWQISPRVYILFP